MKRPRIWIRLAVFATAILLIGEYVALTRLAPQYIIWAVENAVGGEITVADARFSLPFTTTLRGLHFVHNTSRSALSIRRAVIRPRWLSPPKRTLWLDSLEIDRPYLRLTQTKDGTVLKPALRQPPPRGLSTNNLFSPLAATPPPSWWKIHVASVTIVDGTLEWVDEEPPTPFHGVLDHITFSMGPVEIPLKESAQFTFAIRGELTGEHGHAAPLYCSGWIDVPRKDLQAAFRLAPLPLAAFDPYFHGPPEVRVHGATFTTTGQWVARANELKGLIQLAIGNLEEGGLLIKGRTLVDPKKFSNGTEPRLTGEVALSGPFDRPDDWQAEFVPGDELAQRLIKRLLNHGIEMIGIEFFGRRVRVSLAPATKEKMTNIETASKEIAEALDVLALPSAEEMAGSAEKPSGEPSAESIAPPAVPVSPQTASASEAPKSESPPSLPAAKP